MVDIEECCGYTLFNFRGNSTMTFFFYSYSALKTTVRSNFSGRQILVGFKNYNFTNPDVISTISE